MSEKIGQLKMKVIDGEMRVTDVLDTEGILRLIQSVLSPKVEPFKVWLARLGRERVDETFDPEIAIHRVIDLYRKKGYDDAWISKRMKVLQERKQLTDVWKDNGIQEQRKYAILTDLGETATRELVKQYHLNGFKENKEMAKRGGSIAKVARDRLEEKLRESVMATENKLSYEYREDKYLE